MVLIQEFSLYSHFEVAPCLIERIVRQSCGAARGAYCKSGKYTAGVQSYRSRLLRHTLSPPVAENMQYAPRVAPKILALDCKTCNFDAQ